MAIPLNPYVAGNPVGDSPAFVGRADVLREVLRVLRRPQDNAIVLFGQRRIGKTSILQHLAAWLPPEGPYRPVYFDLQDKADWPLDRVLQDLARTIAHTLGQPGPNLVPDPATAFRQEWLPAVLGDLPDGYSLLLLFDEFDVLADPKAKQAVAAFFPYLRDLLASDPRRLQFVFVIGRNIHDLANIALSLFKGTPYQRVSLLDKEDTIKLVRLSEANGTLRWTLPAMLYVYKLTNGHPFLTQQVCSHVWERAYDEEPDEPPVVTPADVEAAVHDALEASRNTLEWLWDGLPPAERVVASALAEAGPGPITQDELEHVLHESGVRVLIRELQNAPKLLQDWDLIEPTDSAYRFRVELLRRWIAEHKPLRRVQEELDRIEPAADSLYQAALGLYRGGQLDEAIAPLRQAINLNPNHVGVNQLLADILLAQGQPGEAQQLLERLYEYQPTAARPRLVQALLAQAHVAESDDEQLNLYKKVLELDPTHSEATTRMEEIAQLADQYQRALRALESEDSQTAQELLARVVAVYPGYEEATRYLHEAVTGEDVAELRAQLESEKRSRQIAEARAEELIQRMRDWKEAGHKESRPGRLSPWNPLSYLRLLWWALVTSWRVDDYEDNRHRVGKWLVSTLIWLPLFFPTLALGLGTLPCAEGISPTTLIWLSGSLALAWLLTGWLGDKADDVTIGVVAIVAVILAFGVAVIVADSVEVGVAASAAVGAVVSIVVIVAIGVAFSVAGDVEFSVAVGVALVVAGVVVIVVAVGVGLGLAGVLAVGAASGVEGVVTVGVAGGLVSGVTLGVIVGIPSVVALHEKEEAKYVVGAVTGGVAVLVAVGVAVGVAGILLVSVAFVTALAVAILVALVIDFELVIVTFPVAAVLALVLAVGVALGLADGVAAGVTGGVAFAVASGVAVSVASGVAVSVADGVEKSLKTRHSSWLSWWAFGALPLAHAFLIWFSFLGGWQMFR